MRILLSAYYCSPYRGSECAVGWQFASRLARTHEVTVLTGDLTDSGRGVPEIERYRREAGLPDGLTAVHVPAPRLARMVHDWHSRPGLWFLYYEAYRRWQLAALRHAHVLHEAEPFDVAHQLTVIAFREPGYLWRLGIPFFWGPISGAAVVPWKYLPELGPGQRFRLVTRNLINAAQLRWARRPARAARAARRVWVVSAQDHALVARWGVAACQMTEVGAEPPSKTAPRSRRDGEPLRVCWSGLFQGRKALPILLHAAAAVPGVTVNVLGDGPEGARWRSLAAALGLDDRLRWHGMLARAEALEVMQDCHVLAHTSLLEATSHVVLEALERGLPVICHDTCGMATAIDERCGLKVPLRDPSTSVAGFADALTRLLTTPRLLETLSRGAAERARELSWDNKIAECDAAYRAALDGSRPRGETRPAQKRTRQR